jgi:hypothetical protein
VIPRAAVAACVLSGAGIASCSLLIDTGGLTSTTIVVIDEAGTDGSVSIDGSPEPTRDSAVAEGGPDAAPPCLFCDGFDLEAPLAPWDDKIGTLATDTADVISKPRSLRIQRAPGGANETKFVRKYLNGTWTSLRCSFEVKPSMAGSAEIVFLGLRFTDPAPRPGYGVSIHIGPTNAVFYEGYDRSGQPRLVTSAALSKTPPQSAWSTLEIELSLAADQPLATIKLGTEIVGTKALDIAKLTMAGFSIAIGVTTTGTEAISNLYDDVVCRSP